MVKINANKKIMKIQKHKDVNKKYSYLVNCEVNLKTTSKEALVNDEDMAIL